MSQPGLQCNSNIAVIVNGLFSNQPSDVNTAVQTIIQKWQGEFFYVPLDIFNLTFFINNRLYKIIPVL